MELVVIPTAAGREQRVVDWVRQWANRRRELTLRSDQFGNLELRRSGKRSARPIYFVAHMDHPAFVVHRIMGCQQLIAEFRGGVREPYFKGSKILLHQGDGTVVRGVVHGQIRPRDKRRANGFKLFQLSFARSVAAELGDVVTWDTGKPGAPSRSPRHSLKAADRLRAPAADNLAGVAAALGAFDTLVQDRELTNDVRVLLTRGEEVGFVGAIGACSTKRIPKQARLIVLEASKSFDDSPIGAGPIVRVGDRVSIFHADLTYQMVRIAEGLQSRRANFRWQRKLMPGGTCEATAFQSFGHASACTCLALGNYHNMNERTGRIGPEIISLSDFYNLIRLLVAIGQQLDPKSKSDLRHRLEANFQTRRALLESE